MKGRKLSFTMRYVLTFGILLFVANVALGFVILNQSKTAMRSLINKDMLDVVNSAAGSLDGDKLAALTADDVDGPVFRDVAERLLVFQNSVDIHFIYAVKQVGEGQFVFTVDPDPVDPGEFGEEVLTTPALVAAAAGTPTVDDEPAADRWGNFYSAYSPVFDSTGSVAGIVGVDFDAQWYDEQVRHHSFSIALITTLSIALGAVVIVLITNRVRLRFRDLDEGLEELGNDVDLLMDEVASSTPGALFEERRKEPPASGRADELEILGEKIHAMKAELRRYLEFMRAQAYTDALTQVENSTAYHEAVQGIDQAIADGTADFGVAVFDVNSLKELNDSNGHECGDLYIRGAAKALEQGFPGAHVYRIGGDEFAVIVYGAEAKRIDERCGAVDAAIARFNEESSYPAILSVSRGVALYDAKTDQSFKDVFARADRSMYVDKSAYYRTTGDRRRRRED